MILVVMKFKLQSVTLSLIFQRDRLAAGLISLGIERGDRVGIWSLNNLEWVLTMMAAARIGATVVNLNPAYQKEEVEQAIKKVIKGNQITEPY